MGIYRGTRPWALALLLTGLFAAPAARGDLLPGSAAPVPSDQLFPVGGPSLANARSIALAYWGSTPCGDGVAVTWGALPGAVNALSNWWNPVAAYGNAAANRRCAVTLNVAQPFDWPMLCTMLVHEYGHLSGHQHTTDPADVMYPVYSNPISQCSESADPSPPSPLPASSTFGAADPEAGVVPPPTSAPAPGPKSHHVAVKRTRSRGANNSRRHRTRRHDRVRR